MPESKNEVIDQAALLLFDKNLVWSSDMEDIKDSLGALLVSCKADDSILKLLAFTVASKIVYQDKAEVFGKIETRDA
jgi:hypothetical protein